MKNLTIAGVPEHFNHPWRKAIEAGVFRDIGADVHWRDFHDGTGAMMRAAASAEVDIALVLTEGAVAHIAKHANTRIVGTWVDSPLVWGIHSGSNTHKSAHYPHDGRIAISRPGSGSHLMALVHADQEGRPAPADLVEVGTLQGALDAFEADRVDAFYWERTMTLPQVQAGQLIFDGDFQAPWPAFVAVRAGGESAENDALWMRVLAAMRAWMDTLLLDVDAFLADVGARFSLPDDELRHWYARTSWAASPRADASALARAGAALARAGVLEKAPDTASLVWRPDAHGAEDGTAP